MAGAFYLRYSDGMNFIGLSLITEDVSRLVSFYERLFSVKADGDDVHSALLLPGLSLSIYSRRASISDMGFSYPSNAGAGYTTLMFLVDDADAEYARIKDGGIHFLTTPTDYPWGTRAFHFTDPEGNIVCFVERKYP